MLFYFKPIRDADRFVGNLLGKLYNRIAPGLGREYRSEKSEDLEEDRQFREENSDIYKIVEDVSAELGEKIPLVHSSYLFGMEQPMHNLQIDTDYAENLPAQYTKSLVTHEMGHLDTNKLGSMLGNLANIFFELSFGPIILCNNHYTQRFMMISALSAAILCSYKRAEEFRCDELTLKTGTSEYLPNAIREIGRKNKVTAGLTMIADVLVFISELFQTHPSSWARQENLRQFMREQDKNLNPNR